MKGLENDNIFQAEYHFGSSDKARKTICTVCVSFICTDNKDNKTVSFKRRFDVMNAFFPFSIGLPSLMTINATLSFEYNGFSLPVHQKMYRMQLMRASSHLKLPFQGIINACRQLRARDSRSNPSINPYRPQRGQFQKRFYTHSCTSVKTSTSSADLTIAEPKKIHGQLGHETVSQLQSVLRGERTRKPQYTDKMKSVTDNCTCRLATPLPPRSS